MEQEVLEKVLDASWYVFKQQVIQSIHAVSTLPLDSKDSVSECGTGANLSQIWSRGVSPDMYIIDHNSLAPSDFREDIREEQMLRRITSQSQGTLFALQARRRRQGTRESYPSSLTASTGRHLSIQVRDGEVFA